MSTTIQSRQPSERALSVLGVLVFTAGATSPVMLNVVGELYLAELLLPLLAFALLLFSGGWQVLWERPFLAMLAASYLMLFGYMLSDIVVGSRPDQYLRGWGRVLLTISDFVACYVIFSRERKLLWWLAAGMGIGGLAYLNFNSVPLSKWKFGYVDPVVVITLVLSWLLPGRLKALPILFLGPLNMWLDYRSFGAVCLAIGAYVWLVTGRNGYASRKRPSWLTLGIVGLMLIAVTYGLLGATADKDSLGRRTQSNAGREAATEIGLIAIGRSPIFGYGSWSEDPELARLQRKLMEENLDDARVAERRGSRFGPHSQVLNAWVEGGILAAGFFLYMLYRVLATAPWILFTRPPDFLSPLLAFFLIMAVWDVLMSPFAAGHREKIGISAAILAVWEIDRRRGRRASVAAARRQSRPPLRANASGRSVHSSAGTAPRR